jgi:Spy/CpxP family protein refolding chaperone
MLRRNLFTAGMFLACGLMAVNASAQGPGGSAGGGFGRVMGGGGNITATMLLGVPEVQKELNITDEQKTKIETIGQDVRDKMQQARGNFNFRDLQNMSDEEQQKAFADIRKKVEEVTKGIDEKVAGILDAKQNERLKQLQLQREGALALTRPEVIKKLSITEEQQAKIKKTLEDARPTGNLFDPNQTPEERQAGIKKIQDQMEKAQKDCLAVLTDDQMLDWTNMCGKTFKFPQMRFGRGNRGGPGGGPGNQPAPPSQ